MQFATLQRQRTAILFIGVIYLSFVILGMPDGLIGTAYPSIRRSFNLDVDAIGMLFLSTTTGYLLASFNLGRIIRRFGLGFTITLSCLVASLGMLSFTLSPTWLGVVLMAFLGGAGGGGIDAGMNVYVAMRYGTRIMNGLHACFGVGATVGPLLMTSFLQNGLSWRWAYALVAVAWLSLGLIFMRQMMGHQNGNGSSANLDDSADGNTVQARTRDTLRLPLVWACILFFALYTGLEIIAGTWIYTLFTEGRGIDETTAGVWISIYWGSLTLGRLLFSVVDFPLPPAAMLRLMIGLALVGTVLMWWNPVAIVGFIGLSVLGFAIAPIFPLMMSLTPLRLGKAHTANAIGFQAAGAGFGVATLPGLVGLLVKAIDLEVIGLFLVLNAILLLAIHELVLLLSRRAGAPPADASPSIQDPY